MKILFDTGESLESKEEHVTIVLSKETALRIIFAFGVVALEQAKMGNRDVSLAVAKLSYEFESGIVSGDLGLPTLIDRVPFPPGGTS